mgnify:CR=1 FL=1
MNVMERPHWYLHCAILIALSTPEVHYHQCPGEVATDDGGMCVSPQDFLLQAGKNGVADADAGAGVVSETDRLAIDVALEEQLVAGERTIEHATGPPSASLLEVVRLIMRRPAAPNRADEIFPISTIEPLTRIHFTLL